MRCVTWTFRQLAHSSKTYRKTEKSRTMRWRWTGQSRAVFERQYLTGSFYLYHSFSVIVAQPLSFTLCGTNTTLGAT